MTLRIIRKRLYENEGAPSSTRVNPDTGVVETSPDGGVTWNPDPNSDPRLNPAYQLPPVTGDNAKCAAAAGMVANVRRVVDGMGLGLSVAGFATLLLTLLLIPGIGWMWAAMLLFASTFTGATALATYAAFTEDVYDALLCAFYEQIDGDGRITYEGYSNVIDTISSQFPNPLVHDALQAIGTMHQVVGINNAGVTYADPEADCGECSDWCYEWDFTLTDGGFYVDGPSRYGEWVAGVGWVCTAGDTYKNASPSRDISPETYLTLIQFNYTRSNIPAPDAAVKIWDETDGFSQLAIHTDNTWPGEIDWFGFREIGKFTLVNDLGTHLSWTGVITSCRVRGIGENPFGEDNC